jgi:hypothetical protein
MLEFSLHWGWSSQSISLLTALQSSMARTKDTHNFIHLWSTNWLHPPNLLRDCMHTLNYI